MLGKGILSLRIVFLLVSLSLVGIVQAQDSIPKPVTTPTIEAPAPPTDITPETPAETAQPVETPSETSAEINSDAYINAEPYIFEEDIPQPTVQQPKVDTELLAALDGNPFGLIRDGKPKTRQKRLQGLPGISPIASTDRVEKPKEEEKEVEEVVEEVEEVFVPVDTSTVALNKLNPFRLEGSKEDRKEATLAKKIKFNPQAGTGAKSTDNTFNPIFDTSKVNVNPIGTLKFVVVILLLGLLTYIVTSFRNEVEDVYRGFLNANLLSLLYREKGTILRLPYFAMYVLAACSFGTMLFLIMNILGETIFKSNFLSVFTCIVGVGFIFLLRHITIALLAYIFPFTKEIKLYGFTIAIFNFATGIGLLPIVTLAAFAPVASHNIILYTTLILFGFVYGFRTIRAIIIGNKYLIQNKFHFFMYLCTVELAPILILTKLFGY